MPLMWHDTSLYVPYLLLRKGLQSIHYHLRYLRCSLIALFSGVQLTSVEGTSGCGYSSNIKCVLRIRTKNYSEQEWVFSTHVIDKSLLAHCQDPHYDKMSDLLLLKQDCELNMTDCRMTRRSARSTILSVQLPFHYLLQFITEYKIV